MQFHRRSRHLIILRRLQKILPLVPRPLKKVIPAHVPGHKQFVHRCGNTVLKDNYRFRSVDFEDVRRLLFGVETLHTAIVESDKQTEFPRKPCGRDAVLFRSVVTTATLPGLECLGRRIRGCVFLADQLNTSYHMSSVTCRIQACNRSKGLSYALERSSTTSITNSSPKFTHNFKSISLINGSSQGMFLDE